MSVTTLALVIAVSSLLGATIVLLVEQRRGARRTSRQLEQSLEEARREALETLAETQRMSSAPPVLLAEPPTQLIERIASGDCVLFAGAGLAAGMGVPSLEALVRSLHEDALDESPFVPVLLDSQLALEMLRARLGDDRLRALISTQLDRSAERRSAAVEALAKLPFAGFVTDDWSGHLARRLGADAVPLSPENPTDLDVVLRSDAPFVLEAYGNVRGEELLLTERDLHAKADRNLDYRRFLVSLKNTRSLLFIGASLDRVDSFLSVAGEATGGSRQQHWALACWEPQIAALSELNRGRHNLELIAYAPDEPRQLDRFAERLLDALPRHSRRRGSGQRPRSTSSGIVEPLSRLRLENIGPFDELDLDLTARRSILLGDNGSGKSSILRAIALALAGAGPGLEQAAQRMLRSGRTTGTIVLTIGGDDEYRVSLQRSRGRVLVDAPAYTPVRGGLWLALGFPPLRGVSSRDPSGPRTGPHAAPSPEDVLPLLSGQPDTRLDDLKQWIVNTWTRAQADEGPFNAYEQMLEQFFEIVGYLLPGTQFLFDGVDERTWRVKLVSEDDGAISFDLLSQGMIAVLGWIGVLLQRLNEVHPAGGDPTRQAALVLVDEIDAHLHPGWQREILPLLDEHFPNLRLVATTHSPLVVTSAGEDDAIVRVERGDDGRLELKPMHEAFNASTSDEVLTSAAFDLATPFGRDTDKRVLEYTRLLAEGRTPDRDPRAAELAAELGEPRSERTAQEAEAAELLREWMRSRLADRPLQERTRLIGEAQRYLDRLWAGG